MKSKKNLIYVLFFSALAVISCQQKKEITLKVLVENTLNKAQHDILLSIQIDELLAKNDAIDITKIVVQDTEILPIQMVDVDHDNNPDVLLVLVDMEASEQKQLIIRELKSDEEMVEFAKRTQAEISVKDGGEWVRVTKPEGKEQYEYQGGVFKNVQGYNVPAEHTDHSFDIRYEGPGWESDKVGYRFYLDWRNAVDIFGKKTNNMVLQDVGQDGFDSYHEDASWGMDILKVGGSLGIGTIAFWDGAKAVRVEKTDSMKSNIVQNGVIKSCIKTNYYSWNYKADIKTDLEVYTSIAAGSRLTEQKLIFSEAPANICTGIVKHDSVVVLKSDDNYEWSYLATFGRQSLNNDMLGMAVFYKTKQRLQLTDDEESYVVVLEPENNELTYSFSATWELDEDNIDSKEKFEHYLTEELDKLNNKLLITME